VFWLAQQPATTQSDVFVSRLHVRYDRAHFPDDLVFQETGDRQNFQARFVLHHPWTGKIDCGEEDYRRMVFERQQHEATNLA